MTLTHSNLLFAVVLIFLFAIVAVIVILLPKLIKKREPQSVRTTEADMIAESFQMLGNELKSLKEQLILKERLATLGEISAGIAHEFRNPMGVIMGYSKLILKSLDEQDSRREIVRSIIREIDGMNLVMDELLKFSKSEPLNKTEVDLAVLISDAIRESVRPEDTAFDGNDIFLIKVDGTLLKQAVKNLLNNALYAGNKVRVNLKAMQLSDRKGVSIEVSDNGQGIAPEAMKKVFLPFYSTKPDGLGVGLSLVQKIVMAHGGSVHVSSAEGSGSTFRIFLPS